MQKVQIKTNGFIFYCKAFFFTSNEGFLYLVPQSVGDSKNVDDFRSNNEGGF